MENPAPHECSIFKAAEPPGDITRVKLLSNHLVKIKRRLQYDIISIQLKE
jgi:hypothetical protein